MKLATRYKESAGYGIKLDHTVSPHVASALHQPGLECEAHQGVSARGKHAADNTDEKGHGKNADGPLARAKEQLWR